MALTSALTDSVTVIHPSGQDEYGNADRSWDNAVETVEPGFFVGRTSTSSTTTEAGVRITGGSGGSLLLGPDSNIEAGDRVRVLGRVYAVVGEPVALRSPKAMKGYMVALSDLTEEASA